MRIVWELFINLIEVSIIFDFLGQYFGYKSEGKIRYWGPCLMGIIAFAIISILSLRIPFEPISTLLVVIVNFMFCAWLLKGPLLEKAFISAFVMALVALVATGTALIFSSILRRHTSQILEVFDPIRVMALIISKVFLFGVTRIVLRLKLSAKLSIHGFILLGIIPLCSILTISFLMRTALRNPDIQGYILCTVALVALINALIYYLFMRISSGNQLKQDYALLELQYRCEQKYSREIRCLYDEIRSVRHDLKNHLLCIESMASKEKYEEVQSYIQDILQKNNTLEHTVLIAGNNVMEAVLNTKISLAEQEGIKFTATITTTHLPLSQSETCVLLGNLMDNAIEATVSSEQKVIKLKIARQDEYVCIEMLNSVSHPVLANNPHLQTTKVEKKFHGFGTKNIKRIVDDHQGLIQYYEAVGMFCCDILIPSCDTKLER